MFFLSFQTRHRPGLMMQLGSLICGRHLGAKRVLFGFIATGMQHPENVIFKCSSDSEATASELIKHFYNALLMF